MGSHSFASSMPSPYPAPSLSSTITATTQGMPRERKPSAKVREMQALEEEHGSTFDSLIQQDMIEQALAMDRQGKASNGEGKKDGDNDNDDDALNEKARLLLERAFAKEDEAMQADDEDTKKRKKPAGTYRWRYDFNLRSHVRIFIPYPDPPRKFKAFRPPSSAFSPLFLEIFNNPRLLHDLFLEPQLLTASTKAGDLLSLALTCKAFAPLLPKGEASVILDRGQWAKLKFPTRFIISLALPQCASALTTLHLLDKDAMTTPEVCYELGDVFAHGLPVLRELAIGKTCKSFTYAFLELVKSSKFPALRALMLYGSKLRSEAWRAVFAGLPLPKPKKEVTSTSSSSSTASSAKTKKATTTAPRKKKNPPAPFLTPLAQLEHLVLCNVHIAKPSTLLRLFDGLAHHKAPLRTLECRRLFNYSVAQPAYEGLAAHLKKGAFPALSSLTVHNIDLGDNTGTALISGMDKGCRAVTRLSLGRDFAPAGHGMDVELLLQAVREVAAGSMNNGARAIKPFQSLQALCLDLGDVSVPTRLGLVGCLLDKDIDPTTRLCLPRAHGNHQPDGRLPFPALSSLALSRVGRSLPVETVKVMLQSFIERGVRDIDLSRNGLGKDTIKDLVAYLRDLLPRLASSVSVSCERPLKVNLAQWICPYNRHRNGNWNWIVIRENEWSSGDFTVLRANWPPGCEVLVEYPFGTKLGHSCN